MTLNEKTTLLRHLDEMLRYVKRAKSSSEDGNVQADLQRAKREIEETERLLKRLDVE